MGCVSSTEVVTDPKTGQKITKHRLGGAHPGNRRKPQPAYTPGASEFNAYGEATAHFVNYGGGNALVLQQHGIAQPQAGVPIGKKPEYIQVTLPNNVNAGDTIHVQAPDGRLNEIVVPPGFGPGSTFTVEFADGPPPASNPPPSTNPTPAPYIPPVTEATHVELPPPVQPAMNNNNHDDGFASGFNNPNFVPMAPPTAAATTNAEPEIDLSAYPVASNAQPVYNTKSHHSASVY